MLCVNNARSLLRSPIRFCLYRLLHNSERTDGARDRQSVRVITVSYIKLSGLDSEGHLPVESILRLVIQLQCVSNSRVMGTENPNLVNTNTIQQCFPTGRGAQKSRATQIGRRPQYHSTNRLLSRRLLVFIALRWRRSCRGLSSALACCYGALGRGTGAAGAPPAPPELTQQASLPRDACAPRAVARCHVYLARYKALPVLLLFFVLSS